MDADASRAPCAAGDSTDTAAVVDDAWLMVGVVVDSGDDVSPWCVFVPNRSCSSSVCSGAVNGNVICSTNQHAISC